MIFLFCDQSLAKNVSINDSFLKLQNLEEHLLTLLYSSFVSDANNMTNKYTFHS